MFLLEYYVHSPAKLCPVTRTIVTQRAPEDIVDTTTRRPPSLAANDESGVEWCIDDYLYYRIKPVKYAANSTIE